MEQEDFEKEIKRDFILEAREMLEDTESAFLDLENNPGDKSILDLIFRLAHTIKGSAYAAGFNGLAEYAHSFETLLGVLRNGELQVETAIVNTLLAANDRLGEYIHALEEDFDAQIDVSDSLRAIKEHLGEDPEAPKTSTSDNDSGLHLFDEDESADPVAAAAPPTQNQSEASAIDKPLALGNDNPISQLPRTAPAAVGAVQPLSKDVYTILVLDDEPDITDIITAFLDSFGYQIHTAGNGNQGLEVMANHKIDLIISDLAMPGMSGIEFATKVRETDKNIPIIYVTGAADRESMVDCINLGAFYLLEKPFEAESLTFAVNNALKYRFILDATLKLSSLNFKAYVASCKMAAIPKGTDDQLVETLRQQLEAILDEISKLTNKVLSYRISHTGQEGKSA